MEERENDVESQEQSKGDEVVVRGSLEDEDKSQLPLTEDGSLDFSELEISEVSSHQEHFIRSIEEEEEEEKKSESLNESLEPLRYSDSVPEQNLPLEGNNESIEEQNMESLRKKTNEIKREKIDWQQWLKERYPPATVVADEPNSIDEDEQLEKKEAQLNDFFESARRWRCPLHHDPVPVPEQWDGLYTDASRENAIIQDKRWVLANIADYNFLKGELLKRCRFWLSGYSHAKGVINYIRKVLLSKKTVYTNEVVCSPGAYGIPQGFFSSFPVRIDSEHNYRIVQGYILSDINIKRITTLVKEIQQDYKQVFNLYYNYPPRIMKQLLQLLIVDEKEKIVGQEDLLEEMVLEDNSETELREDLEEELKENQKLN